MEPYAYQDRFFDYVDGSAARSARAFLARLALGFTPASVLDVGCGRGAWLAAWKARGTPEVLGIDGAYVDTARLHVAPTEFRAIDVSRSFELGRRFDLVQCLEVAEHLPEPAGEVLVESLVRHGDVVIFSAAVPGQGGEHHVNEQPLEYWIERFSAHRFSAYDAVRAAVKGVREIEPWYRYNTLVFAGEAGARRLGEAVRATRTQPRLPLADYSSAAWRIRCAMLRPLPRPVIDWAAHALHRMKA
jgi:SAM-dependent methyltransferase